VIGPIDTDGVAVHQFGQIVTGEGEGKVNPKLPVVCVKVRLRCHLNVVEASNKSLHKGRTATAGSTYDEVNLAHSSPPLFILERDNNPT